MIRVDNSSIVVVITQYANFKIEKKVPDTWY